MMEAQSGSFERRVLGRTGLEVGRLGISSSYGVPGDALERAFERGRELHLLGKPADRLVR